MPSRDNRDNTSLGPGREFDLIRAFATRWGTAATGLGDDAAVLEIPAGARLVVSTDTSVEGTHFLMTWLSPREIGYRALAAALSDLAAMAAAPLAALLAITLPEAFLAHALDLADGFAEAAIDAGCPIGGGDTTRGDRLSITATVLGTASAPVRRSGAQPGHAVFVTGALGGPGAALAAFHHGATPRAEHRARFAHPAPRIEPARWLAEHGATAMIDVSDGLASDARHLSAASDVQIEIDLDRLPCVEGVSSLEAARSGEEYELLLTAPASLDTKAFGVRFGLPLTNIGRVDAAGSPSVRFTSNGARVDPGLGYDHFST